MCQVLLEFYQFTPSMPSKRYYFIRTRPATGVNLSNYNKMHSNTRRMLFASGSFTFIAGFFVTLFWKPLFYNSFNVDLKLINGSKNYKVWSESTVPIYSKIYMFNWTNPEETLAKTEKANFTEMGPYTFRFIQRKNDIVWNKNDTVTFTVDRIWEFIPEMSNGSLSDSVTNINAAAVAIGDRVKDFEFGKFLLNHVLNFIEGREYITKTVEELLFEGYRDQLLTLVDILNKWGINTGFIPAKFGWYFNKNTTDEHIFNMHTGADDLNLLGKVHSWNYNTQCGVYSDQCDQVKGSLGDLWPKNTAEKEIASVFVPDFCGAIDLTKVGTRELYGTEGVQYAGTEQTFDSGVKYSKNSCFSKNTTILPSGVRDVSKCVHGPIYTSFPHFYLADEKYRMDINGMDPVAEKHQFSITVHKELGILMEVLGRLQINIKIEPYPGLNLFSNMPEIMVPTLWFEQYIVLQDDIKDQMTIFLSQLPAMISAVGYSLLIVGVVLLSFGYSCAKHQQQRESESFKKLLL